MKIKIFEKEDQKEGVEELENKLMLLGLKKAGESYDNRKLITDFASSPLNEIVPYWDALENSTKRMIVEKHMNTLIALVKEKYSGK